MLFSFIDEMFNFFINNVVGKTIDNVYIVYFKFSKENTSRDK